MAALRLLAPFTLPIVCFASVLTGCAAPSGPPVDDVPATNASGFEQSLLQDFTNKGKTDENGHPINAIVVEAERFCTQNGQVVPGGFRSRNAAATVCDGLLPPLPGGDQIVNIKLRGLGVDTSSQDEVVKIALRIPGTRKPITLMFRGTSFRANGQWTYLPLPFSSFGSEDLSLSIETFGHGAVELDYIEIFTNEFPIAFGPGSRVLDDESTITVEAPLGKGAPILIVNGASMKLADLLAGGHATKIDTSYRSAFSVQVGVLADGDPADLEIFARGAEDPGAKARMHVYRHAPTCLWEGDPKGKKVLLTGFHPFPVAEWHENVSNVAVRALDPAKLVGAKVMRLTLPVEYDDGPAIVAEAMARCAPDFVIDFGQGGGVISLEHTAHNLKDTGRFVDNRGRFQAGVPINEGGAETLPTALPLDRIKAALTALLPEEGPLGTVRIEDSEDAGRYICNNTFYSVAQARQGTQIRTGFIHLPYTTEFPEEKRAAWGQVMLAIVQATVNGN